MNVLLHEPNLLIRRGIEVLLKEIRLNPVSFDIRDFNKDYFSGLNSCAVLFDVNAVIKDKGRLGYMIRLFPARKWIGLIDDWSKFSVKWLFESGCHACLMKSEGEELTKCLNRLIKEKEDRFIGTTASQLLFASGQQGQKEPENALNEREAAILDLLYQELSAKQIADKLSMSTRTVEWYKKRMMEKTDSRNMIGLIKYGLSRGVLTELESAS
jgi:DNA-binding NarL/FixJ family response regulator